MNQLYAANHIVASDHSITNGVVEIANGIVVRMFRLERETPFTIWLGGTIEIRETDLGLQAFKDNKIIL